MSSPTKRALTPADVAKLVGASFGSDVTVIESAELTGGGYATVWRALLDDGRHVVLKVAPPPGVRLLRYEAGLIRAEAEYFALARAAGVPAPAVLHHGTDRDVCGSDWLVTAHLPGTGLHELRHAYPDLDHATVRRELGAALAGLHRVTGAWFGYSGDRARATTWPDAFALMIGDLLADAREWRVKLPSSPVRIRALVARHADALTLVRRPALLHFDTWDGNVLASVDGGGVARLTGLVDGERYLYGDPLMDFVSAALFRRIEDEPGHPFLAGYAAANGGEPALDEPARRRLSLYRLHLYLLMLAEMPSRGEAGAEHDERREFLAKLVTEQLDDLAD